jgi:hypothetical protein
MHLASGTRLTWSARQQQCSLPQAWALNTGLDKKCLFHAAHIPWLIQASNQVPYNIKIHLARLPWSFDFYLIFLYSGDLGVMFLLRSAQ